MDDTAAALAELTGRTLEEATEAIRIALRGEREPINQVGPSINQADVDARLGPAVDLTGDELGAARAVATLGIVDDYTHGLHP
jgi:hypothetical protein